MTRPKSSTKRMTSGGSRTSRRITASMPAKAEIALEPVDDGLVSVRGEELPLGVEADPLRADARSVERERTAESDGRGARRKWSSSSSESASQTATPRTLLPRASSGGEKTPIPSCPGSTARMPPDTPLFAGSPTR